MKRAAAVTMLLCASAAMAKGEQCLGRGESRWLVDETLVWMVNPLGPENQLRFNACHPLYGDKEGILFDYAAIEYGVFNYTSPVYTMGGGYISVTPLSFMQLRADVAGVGIWPIPLDGAGYYGKTSYVKNFSDATMPAHDGQFSGGINVTLTLNLQGEVPLSERVALQVTNQFAGDYWRVGSAPYWVNLRRDVVLAQSDWLIKDTAFLGVAVKLDPRYTLRVGGADDLTWVPRSGYVGNVVGGFASLPFRRDGLLRDVEPFVRVGYYTEHGFRTGMQLFTGFTIAWALPYEH
jgi:hypothetical protein